LACLAVLQPDPLAAARLRAALSADHTLTECSDVEHFWDVVMADSIDGCVVDIYHPTQALSLPGIQRLRRRVPPLAIVVCADFAQRELDLFELGRLKIDGVILTGTNDCPAETRRAVMSALEGAVALGVTGALQGQLHPLGMECLRWAIENAVDSPAVSDLADSLALTPAALTRELRERGLPTPSRLVFWGRVFRASRLLQDSERSVENIAFQVGYSSGSALGRALRRETGCTGSEMRSRGALACAVESFLRREVRRDRPRTP